LDTLITNIKTTSVDEAVCQANPGIQSIAYLKQQAVTPVKLVIVIVVPPPVDSGACPV